MNIAIFIISLAIIVLLHELGHFIAGKYFKVKVEEFGIGFPPRILKLKHKETIYSINSNWIFYLYNDFYPFKPRSQY